MGIERLIVIPYETHDGRTPMNGQVVRAMRKGQLKRSVTPRPLAALYP